MFISAFLETKKLPKCLSNTSTETAFVKLIFTEFACRMKKVLVHYTGTYRRKKSTDVHYQEQASCCCLHYAC